jgi:hypothetical protein
MHGDGLPYSPSQGMGLRYPLKNRQVGLQNRSTNKDEQKIYVPAMSIET